MTHAHWRRMMKMVWETFPGMVVFCGHMADGKWLDCYFAGRFTVQPYAANNDNERG